MQSSPAMKTTHMTVIDFHFRYDVRENVRHFFQFKALQSDVVSHLDQMNTGDSYRLSVLSVLC